MKAMLKEGKPLQPHSEIESGIIGRLGEHASKAELYLISLSFTILGLSVQFSAAIEPRSLGGVLQVLGWLLLLASGTVGCFLLHAVVRLYELQKLIRNAQVRKESKTDPAELGLDVWFERFYGRKTILLHNRRWTLSTLQIWFLIFGLTALLMARVVWFWGSGK